MYIFAYMVGFCFSPSFKWLAGCYCRCISAMAASMTRIFEATAIVFKRGILLALWRILFLCRYGYAIYTNETREVCKYKPFEKDQSLQLSRVTYEQK